jgi:hypothetical protein
MATIGHSDTSTRNLLNAGVRIIVKHLGRKAKHPPTQRTRRVVLLAITFKPGGPDVAAAAPDSTLQLHRYALLRPRAIKAIAARCHKLVLRLWQWRIWRDLFQSRIECNF